MLYPQLMKLGWSILESPGCRFVCCEMLCFKLLPQFSSHLNETCIIGFLWRVDVHDVIFVSSSQRALELCPFFLILIYPLIVSQSIDGGILITLSGTSSFKWPQFSWVLQSKFNGQCVVLKENSSHKLWFFAHIKKSSN